MTLIDTNYHKAFEWVTTEHFFTGEQFQRDVDYYRAQSIAKNMLERGLISSPQFVRLSQVNRKTFSPFLGEIFPNTVDKPADKR